MNSVYYKYDALDLEPGTATRSTTVSFFFSAYNARAASTLPSCFDFAAANPSQSPRSVVDQLAALGGRARAGGGAGGRGSCDTNTNTANYDCSS